MPKSKARTSLPALLAALGMSAAIAADAAEAPKMVRIDPQPFTMGHGTGEPDEGPPRTIALKPFAIAVTEVTRGDFAAYVRASGVSIGEGCNVYVKGKVAKAPSRSWRDPGFPETDEHPVVCISPAEARAYAQWLAQTTGRKFRLLTEAEWEYAARASAASDELWASPADACRTANLLDRDTAAAEAGRILDAVASQPASQNGARPRVAPCSDGFAHTAPVGRLEADTLGLHDLIGNVWEMVADCYSPTLAATPSNGGAVTQDACPAFVVRGGAWVVGPNVIRLMQRGTLAADQRKFSIGFRLAEDLAP